MCKYNDAVDDSWHAGGQNCESNRDKSRICMFNHTENNTWEEHLIPLDISLYLYIPQKMSPEKMVTSNKMYSNKYWKFGAKHNFSGSKRRVQDGPRTCLLSPQCTALQLLLLEVCSHEVPLCGWMVSWKMTWKWMRTGGSPIKIHIIYGPFQETCQKNQDDSSNLQQWIGRDHLEIEGCCVGVGKNLRTYLKGNPHDRAF